MKVPVVLQHLLQELIRGAGRAAIVLLCFFAIALPTILHAQTSDGSADSTEMRRVNPDSTGTGMFRDTSEQGTMAVVPYSREQEQNYLRALRMQLPPSARFRAEARLYANDWQLYTERRARSPMSAFYSNLDIPEEFYIPSEQERFLHADNIARSQYVSHLGPPKSPGAVGFSMPLSTIGKLLGLIEDVSPTITYMVEYPVAVEAVVYSTQAKVVAVMFRGQQLPGKYALTWNGRDDQGKPLPKGDYIAEVRIGQDAIVRKRMQIP